MFEKQNQCDTCTFTPPCALCIYKNKIEDNEDHNTVIPMVGMNKDTRIKIIRDRNTKFQNLVYKYHGLV